MRRKEVQDLPIGRARWASSSWFNRERSWLAFPLVDEKGQRQLAYVRARPDVNGSEIVVYSYGTAWCDETAYHEEVDLFEFVSKEDIIRACERSYPLMNDSMEGGMLAGSDDSIRRNVLRWLKSL
jgi:hypothetical protein